MNALETFKALGRTPGCHALAESFYGRVAKDPVLQRLFPSGSLRCAIHEFTAYLVQVLGGPPEDSQRRWWLSLRESHARFRIGPQEREAWIALMNATLREFPVPEPARAALTDLFAHASSYLIDRETGDPGPLAEPWQAQLALDSAVAAITAGDSEKAIALAPHCAPNVLSGLLARMIRSPHSALHEYAHHEIRRNSSLIQRRYRGCTLLHEAAAAGRPQTVRLLLELGADPCAEDGGRHTPLYSVANECTSDGAETVRLLVKAGALIDAAGGVQRCTPLHMAARRGNVSIARALLDCGANIHAKDRRGDTPLRRALNCKKITVAELLRARGATV